MASVPRADGAARTLSITKNGTTEQNTAFDPNRDIATDLLLGPVPKDRILRLERIED